MNELREFRKLRKGEAIFVGCDTADGCGNNCAGQFFSPKSYDIPMVYESDGMATEMTPELAPMLNYVYDETGVPPLVAYERAKGGASELEHLAKLNRQGKFEIFRMPITDINGDIKKSDKLGWDTNTATRPQMLQHFKEVVDNKIIRIYDRRTIEQMFSFIKKAHSNSIKAEAETNALDDLVMAAAISHEMFLLYPDYGNDLQSLASAQRQYMQSVSSQDRGRCGY